MFDVCMHISEICHWYLFLLGFLPPMVGKMKTSLILCSSGIPNADILLPLVFTRLVFNINQIICFCSYCWWWWCGVFFFIFFFLQYMVDRITSIRKHSTMIIITVVNQKQKKKDFEDVCLLSMFVLNLIFRKALLRKRRFTA